MASELDFEAAARLLGVPRSMLPSCIEPLEKEAIAPSQPILVAVLSDTDWSLVASALPMLPVAKPNSDFNDRKFIEACRWIQAAKQRGVGWGLLPASLGPESSRRHRWMRWAHLGHWCLVAERLRVGGLSASLKAEFDGIAEDAERYRLRILEQRTRLTGQP